MSSANVKFQRLPVMPSTGSTCRFKKVFFLSNNQVFYALDMFPAQEWHNVTVAFELERALKLSCGTDSHAPELSGTLQMSPAVSINPSHRRVDCFMNVETEAIEVEEPRIYQEDTSDAQLSAGELQGVNDEGGGGSLVPSSSTLPSDVLPSPNKGRGKPRKVSGKPKKKDGNGNINTFWPVFNQPPNTHQRKPLRYKISLISSLCPIGSPLWDLGPLGDVSVDFGAL